MSELSTLWEAARSLALADQASLRTYVGEAAFFHHLLRRDVDALPHGATILEVGSGIGLLAMHLASGGHRVIAFEPQSAGFGQMAVFRELILDHWNGPDPGVVWVDDYMAGDDERLAGEQIDLAIAINVVEHVPDVTGFLSDVISVIGPQGRFRFICPNYAIPYEPHFEIPTLGRKDWTYRVMRRRILKAPFADSQGMWDELSWPTVRSLKYSLESINCSYAFSRDATRAYLGRPLNDPSFMERKGPLLRHGFRLASTILPKAIDRLPLSALPIIDCSIWRTPKA